MEFEHQQAKAIVVGGGVNGIINAILLAEKGYQVTLLESTSLVGGQFRDISVGNRRCDKALYIPQLTGVGEIDSILTEASPVNLRYGIRKDIAGHILNGSHSELTQFPDLRECIVNSSDRELIYKEIFRCTQDRDTIVMPQARVSLHTYFTSKFGSTLTKKLFEPICYKLWGISPKNISSNALKVLHLQRIVAYDHEETLKIKKRGRKFDDLLSFPDQLNVPSSYLADKPPSIYPIRYGLYHLLNGLLRRCKELDVRLLTNCAVSRFGMAAGKIKSLHCNQENAGYDLNCDLVVWCAGIIPMASLLQFSPDNTPSHNPIKHVTCYVLCNQKPNIRDAYWSWDYDSNNIIRISFPFCYASMPEIDPKYIILIEMHEPVDDESPISRSSIIQYLESRKIIDSTYVEDVIVPADTRRNFYIPSINNLLQEELLLEAVNSLAPSNLIHASNKISKNIFYLDDLLRDSYQRLAGYL